MKKAELEKLVIELDQKGRDIMAVQHGSLYQTAFFLCLDGAMHVVPFINEPLHGSRMAAVLAAFAKLFGSVDVVMVQSDARAKQTTPEEGRTRVWKPGEIGEDPDLPELIITSARSREHTALAASYYTRKLNGDKTEIIFRDAEPVLMDGEMYILPNLWSHVS